MEIGKWIVDRKMVKDTWVKGLICSVLKVKLINQRSIYPHTDLLAQDKEI